MAMKDTAVDVMDSIGKVLSRTDVNVEDVRERLNDVADWIKRERIHDDHGTERFVEGLLLGVAVGAIAALLLAPMRGAEMRREITTRGIELKDKAGELASKSPVGDGGRAVGTPTPT
jgi:gas vesicle protein